MKRTYKTGELFLMLFILVMFKKHQVICSLSQYTHHSRHNCHDNDRITIRADVLSGVFTCEHLCSRYEPCVGFVIIEEIDHMICFIKFKCTDIVVAPSNIHVYVKAEETITRSKDIMSKSKLEVFQNMDQYSYDMTVMSSGSDMDCALLCLFHHSNCKGTFRVHSTVATDPGKCHLKSRINNLTPVPFGNTVWVHQNPLLPFYDILNSYTKFESKVCVLGNSEDDLTDTYFLHPYLCAEHCRLLGNCVGFTIKLSTGVCTLKSSCNPGELQSDSNFNTYILKFKEICNTTRFCYTVVTDQVLIHSEAVTKCLSLGKQLVTFESSDELTTLLHLFDKNHFGWMAAPLWTSLSLSPNLWELDNTSIALLLSLPFEDGHPETGKNFISLDQSSGKLRTNNGTVSGYAVCQSATPFTVYGSEGIENLNILYDHEFSTCFTTDEYYAQYTIEMAIPGSNSRGQLILIYGRMLDDTQVHLMYAQSFQTTSDGRYIQQAKYKHCQWMYKTNREDNIQEFVFHCDCTECSKVYLKIFQPVEICEIWPI